MRDRSLPMAMSYAPQHVETRFPVWFCAIAILSASVSCYWLLFRLIGALGIW
jgi:hypothetical protein